MQFVHEKLPDSLKSYLAAKKKLLLLLSYLGHFDFELNNHDHEVRLLGIRFMPLWSLTSNTPVSRYEIKVIVQGRVRGDCHIFLDAFQQIHSKISMNLPIFSYFSQLHSSRNSSIAEFTCLELHLGGLAGYLNSSPSQTLSLLYTSSINPLLTLFHI